MGPFHKESQYNVTWCCLPMAFLHTEHSRLQRTSIYRPARFLYVNCHCSRTLYGLLYNNILFMCMQVWQLSSLTRTFQPLKLQLCTNSIFLPCKKENNVHINGTCDMFARLTTWSVNGDTAPEWIRGQQIQISNVINHSHRKLVEAVKCRKWAITGVKMIYDRWWWRRSW